MPIYEFKCKCGQTEEIILPTRNRNDPLICSVCHSNMQRKMSIPMPAIFIKTGKDMALDSLNSGNTVPDRWYKSKAEKLTAAGIEDPPRTIW